MAMTGTTGILISLDASTVGERARNPATMPTSIYQEDAQEWMSSIAANHVLL